MANSGGLEPDTAASAAASNAVIHLRREYLIIGVPGGLVRWGGRMPDTAMSIAAVNQLPGVPIDKVNGVKCSLLFEKK